MRIHAKLGCLQSVESLPVGPLYDPRFTKKWEEKYACTQIAVDRPEAGVARVDVECPVCGGTVGLKVRSAERIQTLLLAGFLLVPVIFFGFGFLSYKVLWNHPKYGAVPYVLFGLGGLALAAAVAFGLMKPTLIDPFGDALTIAHDEAVENPNLNPGNIHARHKLIDIFAKPAGEPAETPVVAAGPPA